MYQYVSLCIFKEILEYSHLPVQRPEALSEEATNQHPWPFRSYKGAKCQLSLQTGKDFVSIASCSLRTMKPVTGVGFVVAGKRTEKNLSLGFASFPSANVVAW